MMKIFKRRKSIQL